MTGLFQSFSFFSKAKNFFQEIINLDQAVLTFKQKNNYKIIAGLLVIKEKKKLILNRLFLY